MPAQGPTSAPHLAIVGILPSAEQDALPQPADGEASRVSVPGEALGTMMDSVTTTAAEETLAATLPGAADQSAGRSTSVVTETLQSALEQEDRSAVVNVDADATSAHAGTWRTSQLQGERANFQSTLESFGALSSASARSNPTLRRVLRQRLGRLYPYFTPLLRWYYSESQIEYSTRFMILLFLVVGASSAWVGNYITEVLPTIEADRENTPCRDNDKQLAYNAKTLFVYFTWFAVARLSLFIPCVARRVAYVHTTASGCCRTYCFHLIIRDGPLYIFVLGSLLFMFHLMQSPNCDEQSPVLYQVLKNYAIQSCMVSVLCLIFASWHNKLLMRAVVWEHEAEDRSAPPDTLEKLQTAAFDTTRFGDEDDKLYPADCAICLCAWEEEDVIKITPCQHVFHEACIGSWLRTARTCALCRQDLVVAAQLAQERAAENV